MNGAGVVFAGRVLAVGRHDEAGFVDVRFAVDEAVKGCSVGRPYVLREWAGLWSSAAPRYVPGERLLVFLTARGASGLSAPVDGFAGVLPLHATAAQPLADAQGIAPAEDGREVMAGVAAAKVSAASTGTRLLAGAALQAMAVDLRWLRATLGRESVAVADTSRRDNRQTLPTEIASEPAPSPEPRPEPEPGSAWSGPVAPLSVPSGAGNPAAGQPFFGALLTLLRASSVAPR